MNPETLIGLAFTVALWALLWLDMRQPPGAA